MKKMMFNDRYGLTKAVLEGRKTMTRREISGHPLLPNDHIEEALFFDGRIQIVANGGETCMEVKCPYKVGEIVAVAQSYEQVYQENGLETMAMLVSGMKGSAGWKNKMFVRADLMPHQIRITGIRCELLQDISNEDCMREGIEPMEVYEKLWSKFPKTMYRNPVYKGLIESDPRESFASLIDMVSGRGTWKNNPWVLVYEFELEK